MTSGQRHTLMSDYAVTTRKKLIEVALPLDPINKESLRRKQKAPKGWPTSFHKWWAQRPLAAARAVIFSQLVDDPSARPEDFPSLAEQDIERRRLFELLEQLVKWDNSENVEVLRAVRREIKDSWRRTCVDNRDHPEAARLFDPDRMPRFLDPFAGGGSLPLSAQWLGLESLAADLNPVAVVINKGVLEIPALFAGQRPVNPSGTGQLEHGGTWTGARGLAEDVRHYGARMKEIAATRIGDLYPAVEITSEVATGREDLSPYVGHKFDVVAWLWTRTVASPNPAFAGVEVPLAASFLLSSKKGRECYVEPIVSRERYRFEVRVGRPSGLADVRRGTKQGRGANFRCLMSGTTIEPDYVYARAEAGELGTRLLAVVADGPQRRVYLSPTPELEEIASRAAPTWAPSVAMPENPRWFSPPLYGLKTYGDLFTPRQLVGLTTFADLVQEMREEVEQDAREAGLHDDGMRLAEGGTGATAYADAISVYLACVVDRMAYYGSSITTWLPKDNALRDCMPRQALAMAWDFAEGNPFGKSSGDVLTCTGAVANFLDNATPSAEGIAMQADAQSGLSQDDHLIISTDPPYYDNIGYADLSDYFYVWLRRSIAGVFPRLFATVAVPKAEELVAIPHRHGGKAEAERFFLDGMTEAARSLARQAHPAYPITIYYAYKQSSRTSEGGSVSTGWETFLDALHGAGLSIAGTWPLRTEGAGRMLASGTNALASSIVLSCRPLPQDAPTTTRGAFLSELQEELPQAVQRMREGNIAPVDLAQASIGPGMRIFTSYAKVLTAAGESLTMGDALALISETLDEVLAAEEGDYGSSTRWALAWFEQMGFEEGEFGVAQVLSRAKNTSIQSLERDNIVHARGGAVILVRPSAYPDTWDSAKRPDASSWEVLHQLIRVLEAEGEVATAFLVAKLGDKAERARQLAYRLYSICERKKRSQEAMSYNGLVQSWPEIQRLTGDVDTEPAQGALY